MAIFNSYVSLPQDKPTEWGPELGPVTICGRTLQGETKQEKRHWLSTSTEHCEAAVLREISHV